MAHAAARKRFRPKASKVKYAAVCALRNSGRNVGSSAKKAIDELLTDF